MLGEIFRFDLRYQLRTPILWISSLVFGLLAYGATCSDSVQVGGAIGNVHRNAPSVIVNFLGIFSILGMFVIAVFLAGALLRDFDLGTAELFFATPLRKRDYLGGRFLAGMTASLVIYLVVAAGIFIGTKMPWLDPVRLGPFSPKPYLWSFAVLVLPNLLFIGALFSLLAATTRSMLMVYLGIIGFMVLWAVAGSMTRDLENDWVASLLDPFGMRALSRVTRYWSILERNTLVPPLQSFLLVNRIVWCSISAALLAATFALFRTQRAGTGRSWRRGRVSLAPPVTAAPVHAAVTPTFQQRFDAGATRLQFLAELRLQTAGVLRSVPFLVMLAFGMFNFIGSAGVADDLYGTKVYPVTLLMLQTIQGSYSFLLVLIGTFYAGELIWKERAAKLGEVIDALPVPNWVPLLAKLTALIVVVLAFMAVGALTGMGYQLYRGFHHLEPLLYLKGCLLESVPFLLLGILALVLQVLTNNKFVGYLLMIVMLVWQLVLGALHFDHNLYTFAGTSAAPYSDMNGYGHFLRGTLSFDVYWGVLTALLVTIAAAFWVRGTAPTWKDRLREARRKLRGPLGVTAAAAFLAFVGTGCWVYYNTNILNEYVPSDRKFDRQAEYEKKYRQYLNLPMPRITDVVADVDIFPAERRAEIRGRYHLVNRHAQPITELHLTLDRKVIVDRFDFAPAELALNDEVLGYRIYQLRQPLAPGAAMDFSFTVHVAYQGFTNGGEPSLINANGTFFNNRQLFPNFGYDEHRQLEDRNERRKRGLGEVPRMPKLEDEAARANTYVSHEADWLTFETTVSTSADQIALAPGYLQKEWVENGRRHFHYKMDVPMLPLWSYLSARYEVKRDRWKDVAIEIYYDPKHPYDLDRMIDGVKKSLDYFTTNFSPYQHRQVRILEFPRYERFAQSFANTIPFSESIGFIMDLQDPEAVDMPFYVTAHEVAHQWWAHQVIGADLQGSTMLSESLAQYSALMVMEQEYGRERMRKFLKYELDDYLKKRGGELVEELPLFRVENQPYIHYRKGSLAFYRLRDEIGEDHLNRALSKYLHEKGYQQPPFTTSRELLADIRAETPADRQQLVTDLFEKIIFYDNRAEAATARKRPDGKYEVTLDYVATKLQADGLGAEHEVPLDDWIDVGVFARPRGAKESQESVLALRKEHILSGRATIRFVVDAEPSDVGIDPFNKLIDRVPTDNRKQVTVQ
jgi:ABC-type transport system involved in multi-copper enzyme maturation permease subunit